VYCFEHIPKTAGTSVNSVFKNYYKDAAYNLEKDKVVEIPKNVEMVYGHRAYRTMLLNGNDRVKLVTFVRNPVELVKSHFGHLSRGLSLFNFYNIHIKKMDLKDYIDKGLFKDFDNGMVRRFSNIDFEYGKCSQIHLNIAIENLDKYIFIGIQEKFNESIFSMSKILKFKRYPVYIKSNIHSDNTRKYNSKYDELLITRLQYDIKLYEYCLSRFNDNFNISKNSDDYIKFIEIQSNINNIDIDAICYKSLNKIIKTTIKNFLIKK
jgi:hypothetical protein